MVSPQCYHWGGGVPISPDHSKKVTIPLVTVLRGVFVEHSFQCPIEPFHHPVAFGMVGSGVQLLSSHQCTDVLHDNKFVP